MKENTENETEGKVMEKEEEEASKDHSDEKPPNLVEKVRTYREKMWGILDVRENERHRSK
jgi:hypothetical protein